MRQRYSSRLQNREKKELYRRTSALFIISVVIILGVVIFGIPLMVRISLVLDSIKGTSDPIVVNDQTVALSPRFIPSYEATNSAQITIEGYSNEGNTVELFVNGEKSGKVVVSKDGLFNFSDIELTEGDNTITAIATGTNGKKSLETAPLKILYKKDPPKLDIESPKDGESFSGENKEITIKGKTDAETKVYINERIVIVAEEGSFEFKYTLADGDNSLKIQAMDRAGNKEEKEIKVKYSP